MWVVVLLVEKWVRLKVVLWVG
jgi:hypothetical protein